MCVCAVCVQFVLANVNCGIKVSCIVKKNYCKVLHCANFRCFANSIMLTISVYANSERSVGKCNAICF